MTKLLKVLFKRLFSSYIFEHFKRLGQIHISTHRPHYPYVTSLENVAVSAFSQFGDDGIIDFLLTILDISVPTFIEIGTEDYSESNTTFLYATRYCRGLIIDSLPDLPSKVSSNLHSYLWKGDLSAVSAFVDISNISPIVSSFLSSRNISDIDLVSLDIDGNDFWIANQLLLSFKPRIFIVEYNAHLGHRLPVSTPYSSTFTRFDHHYSGLIYGASLPAFIHLFGSHGYHYIGSNDFGNNAYFLCSDDYSSLLSSTKITESTILQSIAKPNFCREARGVNSELKLETSLSVLAELHAPLLVNILTNEPVSPSALF